MPGSPYPYASRSAWHRSASSDSDSSDQPLSKLSKTRSPTDRRRARRLSAQSTSSSSTPHPASSPIGEAKEQQTQATPEEIEEKEEDIPDLKSIFPSIFVPCTMDYIVPPPPEAHDTSHRLASRLSQLDANSAAVKCNIAAMVLRESRRIQQTCRKKELAILSATGQLPLPSRRGPTLGDEAALVRRLEAKPHHGVDYNLGAGFGHAQIAYGAVKQDDTPREEGVEVMLNTFKFGMQNMTGYEEHLQTVREQRKVRFAREVAAELGKKAAEAAGRATVRHDDIGVQRMDIG